MRVPGSLPRVLVLVAPSWAPAPASIAIGLDTGALGGWSTKLGPLRNVSTGSGTGSLEYISSFVIQIKGRIIMSHAFSSHSKYNFPSSQRGIGIGEFPCRYLGVCPGPHPASKGSANLHQETASSGAEQVRSRFPGLLFLSGI